MTDRDKEPSVEEILSSIKRIIADTDAPPVRSRGPRAARISAVEDSPVAEDDRDDVLELSVESMADDDAAPVIDFAESLSSEDAALIDDAAAQSVRHSLSALAALSEPGARPQIVRSGETSLEGLARELLRPALTEWLDKNLPPLVERMVASEIARIVGKKG